MPQLQSLETQISSGFAGTSFQTIQRVQSVSLGTNIQRVDSKFLGRFKVANDRPVLNFAVPQFNVSFIKSSNEVESNFGLVNSTGVGIIFGNTDGNTIAGYGARNLQFLSSPSHSNNYNGQMNIYSGVISSYSVSASVGEPAKASFAGEALDWANVSNNGGKNIQLYSSNLVVPENVKISGIDVSGFGLSGINAQSFDLGLNFSRQSAFVLGTRFPISRLVTDINATLSIKAFFEGTTLFTGFGAFNCGQSYTGTIFFTLLPNCNSGPGTTYSIVNPYIDSVQIGSQVGSFTTVDLQFSIPISINSGEAVTGSNLVIT